MAFHRCTVRRDDGSVVCQDVTVSIEVLESGWHGTLSVSHTVGLVAGERYRIVLDNGRAGEFVVQRNTFAGGTDRAVAIRGTDRLA